MTDYIDSKFNELTGDGADPEEAPPGQHTMDPYDVLSGLPSCEILEKVSAIEAAAAAAGQEVEMPNRYTIKGPDGGKIFFVKETTGCCQRQLKQCFGDCAPWDVDFRVINGEGQSEEAFKIERPFTCTCCCFNRPTATITDVQSGDEVATMQDPCACCDLTFRVQDGDGEDLLTVNGGCCQLGLFCPLPCGPCAEVNFDVKDTDGNDVAHIQKKVPSCLKFIAAPDVDNYNVDFDAINETFEGKRREVAKLAIMAISIFIDFRYFNDNPNDEDEDGDHIPDRFDFDIGEAAE